MGIGSISNKSRCSVGATLGSITLAASQVDVILALGCKFSFTMAHGAEPLWKNSQKVIQVDIDSSIIGRNKPISLGIVGDCKLFLKQILEEAQKTQKIEKREWLESLIESKQKRNTTYIKKASKDKIPIVPQRMIKDVFEL